MDYWFLDSPKAPAKARHFLHAMYRAARIAGAECSMGTSYQHCKALVTYGLGGADRYTVALAHIEKGKPLLGFDLGYWDRNLTDRKYRFTLNGMHPRQVMAGQNPGPERFDASGLVIETLPPNPQGPILLVGNAPKSIAAGAAEWTAAKSREVRAAFPGVPVLYRPKPKRPAEIGVLHDGISTGPIDEDLRRVSLVVCRHSNVAVDACRHGVPVVCDDGAAACIYPQALAHWQQQPNEQTRREFLYRLAWWQWSANEAQLFWRWFFSTFPAHDYRRLSKPGRRGRHQRRMAR